MRKELYKREEREKVSLWMLSENRQLMEFIVNNYEWSTERMMVLGDILSRLGSIRNQKVKDDIYLYGSMIRQQDLIARQMFLWLLALAEEAEQTEMR